jgi:hypothetical protein
MKMVDGSAIQDPEIREVYCRDILHMSSIVQNRFGILPFLYSEGPLDQVTGFYHFRVFTNIKKHPSETF